MMRSVGNIRVVMDLLKGPMMDGEDQSSSGDSL